MASAEGEQRPLGSRRHSFMRMLDLEKKHKVHRMQSSTTSLPPVQPVRTSTSTIIYDRRPSNVPKPGERPYPLQPNSRAMTVPDLSSFPTAPTTPYLNQNHYQLQNQNQNQTQHQNQPSAKPHPHPEVQAQTQIPERSALRVEIPSKQDDNDEGNMSDATSICQSPGWDDSKTRKEKKEAREAKERRRKDKTKAEKIARDAEKRANEAKKHSKKLGRAPPTNKIFEKMGSVPVERSTSAPILDTISEQHAATTVEVRQTGRSSRRSSLEAGFKGLKILPGQWGNDKITSPDVELSVGTGGFVGGLKLTQEKEGAIQEQIRKQTSASTNDLLDQTKRGSSAPPGQRILEFLKFEPTMPPPDVEWDWNLESQSRDGQASFADRMAGDHERGSGDLSPTSIMERKIKRRPKSKISSADQERLDARNGFPPLPTPDGIIQTSRLHRGSAAARPRPERIVTEPIRISDELAEMPVLSAETLRGRGEQAIGQNTRQQSGGRPVTAVLQHDRTSSTSVPSEAAQHSSSRKSPSSLRPKNLAEESDCENAPDQLHDSYHSFMLEGQLLPPNQLANYEKSSKNPMSPSFKNFKTAAKAAFSKSTPTPSPPGTADSLALGSAGQPQSSGPRSSTNGSKGNFKALTKAERILGESMPPVPPIPPTVPAISTSDGSRASHTSSKRSSSENSLYDESSTNITTPSASRPHSQKDEEFYAARDFKAAAAASIISETYHDCEGGDQGSTYEGWSRTAVPIEHDDDDEHLGRSVNSKSTPKLLASVAAGLPTESSAARDHSIGKSVEGDVIRRPSLSRSHSTPEMTEDLSFLPPLKHQSLARPSKGKGKEESSTTAKQSSDPVSSGKDTRPLSGPSPKSHGSEGPGGQYLQNARKNIPVAGPLSNISKSGRLSTMQIPGNSSMSAEPIAKMFVVCCSCRYFHDMPSKIYECMAKPYNIVEDKDLGVSGKMTTAILCPWCSHNMTTQCCAGYAAIVVMQEKLH